MKRHAKWIRTGGGTARWTGLGTDIADWEGPVRTNKDLHARMACKGYAVLRLDADRDA